MKSIKLLLIMGVCLILLDGDAGSGDQTQRVILISCPDSEGCFRVIEQAVKDAPQGAIIKIGAGLYYEKPFTIEKDLTLERAEDGPRPELRFIDPGFGITIQFHAEQATPMAVTLQGLRLTAPQDEGLIGRTQSGGLAILGTTIEEAQAGAQIDALLVIIRDSMLVGYAGIRAEGAHLIMEDTIIGAISWGVHAEFSKVEIGGSAISVARANELDHSLSLYHATAVIRETELLGGGYMGVFLAEGTKSTFVGNTIGHSAKLGISITDDAEVELVGNLIVGNGLFGIALPLAPCAVHPSLRFRGSVSGSDNEFTDNGQNLCPGDYPWPPGFTKP